VINANTNNDTISINNFKFYFYNLNSLIGRSDSNSLMLMMEWKICKYGNAYLLDKNIDFTFC